MNKKKLTRERLRQIIREEKRKLVTEIRDRGSFFVVIGEDQDGQPAFVKSAKSDLVTYDITEAVQSTNRGAAERIAEEYYEDATVSKVQYNLSNF